MSASGTGPVTPGGRREGLAGLSELALSPRHQSLLEMVAPTTDGSQVWRRRKLAEARDLLLLSQIAPPGRMAVDYLDLAGDLRALVQLGVPVPVKTAADSPFMVADRALLGIRYPEDAIRKPMPGFLFVQILAPHGVWHANVARDVGQPLCLGVKLPAGIPVRELVLLAYGALSLQTVMIDEGDPAGVLNKEAARWWQQNRQRIPLITQPFLAGATGETGVAS